MPRRVAPRLITLSSDVGAAYAAQMKGVLARRRPPGTVIDLSHDLRPQAIEEGAFLLRAMARGFPAGTVHVAVVDPGVGGSRRPIVISCTDGSTLVGPDNGVLVPLADQLGRGKAYRIDVRRLDGPTRVGATFDGRDIFAPAAATLADGVPAHRIGPPVRPRLYSIPDPRKLAGRTRGEIVHEDHFGNLVTNVPSEWAPSQPSRLRIRVGGSRPRLVPFATSYEALGRGHLGCLPSSFGLLELAVAGGSAAHRLTASVGTALEFRWERAPSPGSSVRR